MESITDQIIYLLDDADRLTSPDNQDKVTEALVALAAGDEREQVIGKADELIRSLTLTANALNSLTEHPHQRPDDHAERLKIIALLRQWVAWLETARADERLKVPPRLTSTS